MTEASAGVNTLERTMLEAIRAYEPRIHPDTVRVRMSGSSVDESNTKLVFEIEGELWLVAHPDLRNTARVRTFLDFCTAELAKRRKLLECKI